MRNSRILTSCLLLCALYLMPFIASANLLIHPIRVNFEPNERSQTLTLANTSKVTSTYQLEWVENTALPGGGYKPLPNEQQEGAALASQFVRFSPRQVTLRPNERQKIKLLLRRARNLPTGEYRSHLKFRSVPVKEEDESDNVNAVTMKIDIALSFAIPVTLRVGEYQADVAITNAEIIFDRENQSGNVLVEMNRSGPHSTWGDLTAYWTPTGGEEVLLAKSANLSLWPENNAYQSTLIWAVESFTPSNGKLRISYEGVKKFRGITYANNTFNISAADIMASQPAK